MSRRHFAAAGTSLLVGCRQERSQRRLAPLDLSALETATGTTIGLAMLDIPSGQWSRWRADDRFACLSTAQLFLAAATLERAQAGAENLERSVAIEASDVVAHAPIVGPAVGSDLTVRELARAMVTLGDDAAAGILVRELGGPDALGAWFRRLGDDVTRIDSAPPAREPKAPGYPGSTATPRQTVANLVSLFETERLTAASRALLLGWLSGGVAGENRLQAAVAPGIRVAHKAGTGPGGAVADIGVVYPAGRLPVYAAVYVGFRDAGTTPAGEEVLAEAARRALAAADVFWRAADR